MMKYQQKPRSSKSKEGQNLGVVIGYLKLLKNEKNYNRAFLEGPIRFKTSFIKYLNWLVSKGLIVRRVDHYTVYRNGEVVKRKRKPVTIPSVFFKITDKGRTFLEMIA